MGKYPEMERGKRGQGIRYIEGNFYYGLHLHPKSKTACKLEAKKRREGGHGLGRAAKVRVLPYKKGYNVYTRDGSAF